VIKSGAMEIFSVALLTPLLDPNSQCIKEERPVAYLQPPERPFLHRARRETFMKKQTPITSPRLALKTLPDKLAYD
jgi:hypothetical protein